ncbi:MAG: transposase family protein, partial [bacterium]|nr:transposase family protein [bacterium]
NWVEPIKRKNTEMVRGAFLKILERAKPRRPNMVFSDRGLEFVSSTFYAALEEYGIQWYTTKNYDIKSAIIECFNRTLKGRIWKYLTHSRGWHWVDVLQDISRALNRTKT